jgi:Cu2+-exporting ATPase
VVSIPLAAGAFAWAGITMPPAVGAILMSFSTIVVAFNAQLLRRVDLRPREPAANNSLDTDAGALTTLSHR